MHSFEVASIKPAAPQSPGMFRIGTYGGPGTPDPGQARFENVTQRMLLTQAYDVHEYQISGPAWLDSERYDIVAKVPKGANREQFRLMLQDLLANRFHLTLHHETKDLPRYELVVAKGGPKMKEAAPPSATEQPATPDGPGAPPPPGAGFGPPPGPPPGPRPGGVGAGRPPMELGKDGFPKLPPGAGRNGIIMMMMPGRARLFSNAQPMLQLVKTLSSQLGRTVIDKTGLTGVYDFTVDFDPASVSGMRGMIPPPPPGGGGPGGGPGGGGGVGPVGVAGGGGQGPSANQPDSDAPGLIDALQQQLGLKLEQKKGPVDLLVVDHSEKIPVED
jgi:uncharacterized protein (TIGR03435 family)